MREQGTRWVAPGSGSTVSDIGSALWSNEKHCSTESYEWVKAYLAARETIKQMPAGMVTRLSVGDGPYDIKDLDRIAALLNFPEDFPQGPKPLDSGLKRCAKSEILDIAYVRAHGKAPRGRGSWGFCEEQHYRLDYYLDFVRWAPSGSTFAEAKKWALEAFPRGSRIVVCS